MYLNALLVESTIILDSAKRGYVGIFLSIYSINTSVFDNIYTSTPTAQHIMLIFLLCFGIYEVLFYKGSRIHPYGRVP